jgi:hypothetical protein
VIKFVSDTRIIDAKLLGTNWSLQHGGCREKQIHSGQSTSTTATNALNNSPPTGSQVRVPGVDQKKLNYTGIEIQMRDLTDPSTMLAQPVGETFSPLLSRMKMMNGSYIEALHKVEAGWHPSLLGSFGEPLDGHLLELSKQVEELARVKFKMAAYMAAYNRGDDELMARLAPNDSL